jgi:uncharacterized membrane protein YczE
MKTKIVLRFIRLFGGLGLYAFAISLTINANLGLGPWDVFHQGVAKNMGITIGQASIMVSVILVILNIIFKEKIGWSTLADMLCIGLFLDLILLSNIVPICNTFISGIIMLGFGILLMGFAIYLCISASLGCGPRDALMVVLIKKTNISTRIVRSCIEVSVLIAGYLLGGFVGVGTVVIALGIGFSIQLAFKIFKLDIKEVKHRFISDDIKWLKEWFQEKKKESVGRVEG